MTLSELIAIVGEYLWNLWPLRIVNAWEQGVRMRNGHITAVLPPGLHWFWPIIGEIKGWDVMLDVNTVANQTVETADGIVAVFSLTASYRVADLQLLFESIVDHEHTILNQVSSSAAGLVATMAYDEIATELPEAVYHDLVDRFAGWGVTLEGVGIFNLCSARAFRLFSQQG